MSDLDALVDKLAEKVLKRVIEKLGGDTPAPSPEPVVHTQIHPAPEPEPAPISDLGAAFRSRTTEVPADAGVSHGIEWDEPVQIEDRGSTGHLLSDDQINRYYQRDQAMRRNAVPVEDEMAR